MQSWLHASESSFGGRRSTRSTSSSGSRRCAGISPVYLGIIKAVSDSVAYCDSAYMLADDKRAAEIVELPFGMGKGARALPLILNTGHVQEHYGNLVTYFRIKGIVPPSSR